MIPLIRRILAGRDLKAAQRARQIAQDAYNDATGRRDSRDQHRASVSLYSATTELLRRELAR